MYINFKDIICKQIRYKYKCIRRIGESEREKEKVRLGGRENEKNTVAPTLLLLAIIHKFDLI